MAYDQKIIFEVKTSFDSDTKVEYTFEGCEWGWFVKDSELSEMTIMGELEYKAILSPEEMVKRFEANKKEIENSKAAADRYAKWYRENTENPSEEFLKGKKIKFFQFERLVYDRRVIRIIFHKFWLESGLN
jgi:hypothetical protein